MDNDRLPKISLQNISEDVEIQEDHSQ